MNTRFILAMATVMTSFGVSYGRTEMLRDDAS
jgi:hypothetical protein